MEKEFPAADISGVTIGSVSVNASSQVVVDFATPSYSQLEGILGTTIVPKSIWSTISNPTTFEDSNPVGTGPYMLKTYSPEVITVTNPYYWQPKLAKFSEVQALQEDTGASVQASLETGTLDWTATQFADASTITRDTRTSSSKRHHSSTHHSFRISPYIRSTSLRPDGPSTRR